MHGFSRRSFLGLAAGVAVAPFLIQSEIANATQAAGGQPVSIVIGGEARAVVVVPDNTSAALQATAQDLVSYVQRVSGAVLPIRSASLVTSDPSIAQIRLGSAATVENGQPPLADGLDPEGFVIHVFDRVISIVGPSDPGTQLGVTNFLEQFLAVRWLMPTEIGIDTPSMADVHIPEIVLRKEPATGTRQVSPLFQKGVPRTREWAAWGERMGIVTRRVEFHHNLFNVIPPAKFRNTHPEFFPLRGGVPFIPADNVQVGWQPRFGAPGIADAAAEQILGLLSPDATSFSLGVNDSAGFSEDEMETSLNSFGFPNASEAYYRFVNAVAERLESVRPDLKIGLLAYTNVADPPTFDLHPNIVPYLARDRGVWAKEADAQEDRDWTAEWATKGVELAWYDYVYGAPYCVPRMQLATTAEALRYAKSAGVKHQYSELYPNWGEGPKPWVYSKLLWDPDADPGELVREWCERAVGPQAGAALAEFYELWEHFWLTDVPQTDWFGNTRIYQQLNDAGYLIALDPQKIVRARQLIDSVVATAPAGKAQQRADLLQRAFEYYEASAISYPKPVEPIVNESAALGALQSSFQQVDRRVALGTRRMDIVREVASDPLLFHNPEPAAWSLIWSGWDFHTMWAIREYIQTHEPADGPVRREVRRLLGTGTDNQRAYANWLQAAVDGVVARGESMSFETTIAPWTQNDGSQLTQSVPAHEGSKVLQLRDGYAGAFTQSFDVSPGPFTFSIWFRSSTERPPSGYCGFVACNFLDANGKLVRQYRSARVALDAAIGRWRSAVLAEIVPEGAVRVTCQVISESNGVVFVDDAQFLQIAQPEVSVLITPRTLAGKVNLSVAVTNESDVPLNVTVKTDYGSKSFSNVAAGSTVSASASSKLTSIPAGEVVVRGVGASIDSTKTVHYEGYSATS